MVEILKKGKKRWIGIIGPPEFKGLVLGESYVIDPQTLVGKKLSLNLSNLIGDMRKQNIVVGFKIKEIKGAEAHADIVSYEMLQSHVKRLIRSEQDKIDDSFEVESKDKIKLLVKPIIITTNKTKNSVLTKIRMRTREKIKEAFLQNEFKPMLKEIMGGYFQKSIKQELRKIYPLSIFEIRKVEIVNR